MRRALVRRGGATAVLALAATAVVTASQVGTSAASMPPDRSALTSTPIKHLVVIVDEDASFDHYFATYPKAANTDGTPFQTSAAAPKVNNLRTAQLLTRNPNRYPPTRLAPDQAVTCEQDQDYESEQQAEDGGRNDRFVPALSVDTCAGRSAAPGLSLGYYDGNTVTGLWQYAEHYAMSDNSFATTFGRSTPGALNLVSGQTQGAHAVDPTTGKPVSDSSVVVAPDAAGVGTVVGDPDPAFDDCSDGNRSSTADLAVLTGPNIGDLLNQRGVTWGWFQGGFRPTTPYAGSGSHARCAAAHPNVGGASSDDYSAHHSPFQYYASTANPHHLPPTSVAAIGHTDRANHDYDLTEFTAALESGTMPAVSFLKAAEYQDGDAAHSDPIDEQHFLTTEIDAIETSRFWSSTAIVITYDGSGGWYDHVASPVLNASADPATDAEICTSAVVDSGIAGGVMDRCGPGPRLPLVVLSPWSKTDYVDHRPTEQASVLRFIEDNWSTGRIGGTSFDQRAGAINGMFAFAHPNGRSVILGSDGSLRSVTYNCKQFKLAHC